MPKHLKKKEGGYRIFSTKPPKTDTPSPDITLPWESETEADNTKVVTELEFENLTPTIIEPEEGEMPPKTGKAEPRHATLKARHAPEGRRGKLHLSKKNALRILAAVAAAAVVIAVVIVATGRGGSPLKDGYVFSPRSVDATKPSKLISETAIMVDDKETDSYTAADDLKINFPKASEYTEVEGITGFRGNNFRDSASYGTAALTQKKFTDSWSAKTGSLADASGNNWTGSGWTGQPLVMTWPADTRKTMKSMYDWAKNQQTLTEVIYPTMDGKIYFLELSTGKATRDPMNLGYTFKGTGCLDPRGYPILYIGSGVNSKAGKSRVFVINLLDNSVMYTFGYYEPFAQRDWNMWDSSPLVDSSTDQLVYPGENGVLYIVHLNTFYDKTSGALTVSPDNTVRWRYKGTRSTTYTFWTGVESSPVCWQGHIIMADNGGNLMCLDLNTLKLDWVQDVLDDTNCSPVLALEEDGSYIYISTSFHPGWRDKTSATVPVWKISAVTGEVIWQTDYTCTGADSLCGGAQGTLALGKNKLENLVFVPLASTTDAKSGKLVALDRKTGKQVWEYNTEVYSWSSPVDVYDADGNGYLVYCTADGKVSIIDGLSGKVLDTKDLGGSIEASPIVYGDYVVVGSRDSKIYGLKLG